MGNLTIDQILSECQDEIQTFDGSTKEASVQSDSSNFSDDEIVKMAELLKEADISEEKGESRSLYEKVAEAMILNDTLQNLEQTEKVAGFRDAAIKAGYDASEVDCLIEKEAGMNMLGSLVSKGRAHAGKLLLGTAALGAAGTVGGHEYGEGMERERARKVIGVTSKASFRAGRKFQHRRSFTAGANHQSKWRQQMENLRSKKAQQ